MVTTGTDKLRTCLDCGVPMISQWAWRNRPELHPGHAPHISRGVCKADYDKRRRAGTVHDLDRLNRSRDDVLDDYAILSQRGEGYTRAQIAARLGYKSRDGLDVALVRARRAGDERVVGPSRRRDAA
jgi:hypothetical protein